MFNEETTRLAELIRTKNALEDEIALVKEKLINKFKANNLTSLKSDNANFTLAQRRTYTYSDAVKRLEEDVKLLKVEEEETGVADVRVTEFLAVKLTEPVNV